jgi:hypothetical protein
MIPMPSLNAAGHPAMTRVSTSIAQGKYSMGIWMIIKVALFPRLSCAKV